MSSKSITLSDAHIKKRNWVSRPQLKEDAYKAITQTVDYCIQHEASLKIAGDLFDVRTPESRDIKFFMDQMDRMETNSLEVFAIQGNHDKTQDVPWFCLHKWVQWVDKKVFEPMKGYYMYALDYRTRTELEDELADIPPHVKGIMLHQGTKKVLPFDNAWELDEEILPSNIEYVDLGHIHNAQIWEVDGHTCSYPGSPHVTGIDADPQRHTLMQEYDGTDLTLTELTLKTRGYERIVVQEIEGLELEISHMIEHLMEQDWVDNDLTPVLYLKYDTTLEGEVHSIVDRIKDEAGFYPWFAPCKPEQLTVNNEVKEELKDASVEEMAREEAETPALAEFVMGLLVGNVPSILEGAREEIFDDND